MQTLPNQASITLNFSFEAAHFLPHVREGHKCARVHGHSYRVALTATGPIDSHYGWVLDFDEIEKVAAPIIDALDHRTLNDIKGLENPTSENIAVFLIARLSAPIPLLSSVTVFETANASCVVHREK